MKSRVVVNANVALRLSRRSAQGVPERSLSRLGEDPTYLRPQRAQAGGQNKVSFEIREAQTLQDV